MFTKEERSGFKYYPYSSSGIVHDPNCPCKQNK